MISKRSVDTLILSDMHLGLPVSRTESLLEVLKSHIFRRLILNGDIFDNLNFKRLKNRDWEFLSIVRELSDVSRGIEVIWIYGNHDEALYQLIAPLIGISVPSEYVWTMNGKRYLAIHGHQFDDFVLEKRKLSTIASTVYYAMQRLEGRRHILSRYMKRMTKRWLRNSEKVGSRALEFGKTRGVDYIFCGHTHHALEAQSGNVRYFNSGSWTDSRPSYIVIEHDGAPHLEIMSSPVS